EALARRVREAALEVFGGGERDRVHDQVELSAEGLADLGEDAREVVVRADVAPGDERAPDRAGELADVALDPLALEGERELRAPRPEPRGDRPGDRAPVRDAEHQSALALEHGGDSIPARLRSAGRARRSRHGGVVGDRGRALPHAPRARLARRRALAAT